MGAIVVFYRIVDGIFRQFGVQFAKIAVLVSAVEVVDAVSDVGSLLDFGQKTTRSDAVDTSCRQEEHVARLYVVFVQCVTDGVFFNHLGIFFGGNFFLQSGIKMRFSARIVDDVPHLRLSHGLVALHGQLVVGVYLDG